MKLLANLVILLGLAGAASAQHTVDLTWNPPVQPPTVTNVEVFRSTNCNATTCKGYAKVATVAPTVSAYTDTLPSTILAGRRVAYYLLAVGPTGKTISADPTWVRVTVP